MQRRHLLKTLLAGSTLASGNLLWAQDKAPLKLLVGFAPGGGTDVIARTLAERLRVVLNTPVIVENKPGVSGRLAAQALASSAPDGRTLMVAPHSVPVFHEILYPRNVLGMDLMKDITPVGTIVGAPFALVVNKSLGVKTAKEFVAWAKANPGKLSIGNGSPGGQGHFLAVQLGMVSGTEVLNVPYKGHAAAIVDLLGGQLAGIFLPAQDFMQYRNDPRVTVVGLADEQRSPLVPDLPTLKEQGLEVSGGLSRMGLWAPGRTPKDVVEKLSVSLREALIAPEFVTAMRTKYSQEPIVTGPEGMDQLLRKEMELWRPVIKASGFKPDQ